MAQATKEHPSLASDVLALSPAGPAKGKTAEVRPQKDVATVASPNREFPPSRAVEAGPPQTVMVGGAAAAFPDAPPTNYVPQSGPSADNVAEAVAALPAAGDDWLGFRLVQELGRGAFGRVFLATQEGLAGRPVALKVGADLFEESQTLAQLQHTHIVPIYSAHRAGPVQALCMPYFGATTLADVLKDLGAAHTLPESGKALLGTINHRKSITRRGGDAATGARASRPPAAVGTLGVPPAPPAGPAPAEEALTKLEKLRYVDAVLWVAARLTEGLAHAHDRGVFHRDLKPANVLLTDDGRPMLLDFNLSETPRLRHSPFGARVGGTLPYMAPEHLEAFQGRAAIVDGRSDLYSLGVIVFELLTGRHPFPVPHGALREALPRMIADRRTVPRLRCWNKKVSPAAEAIVRRCLAPHPADRYQSAHQLLEDLERHRRELPLRHAAEPSVRERATKWLRRHRRLTVAVAAAAAAATLILPPAVWYADRERRLHQEARDTHEQFRLEMETAERLLNKPSPERADLDEGARAVRAALGRYHVFDDASWREQPVVHRLADPDQARLGEDVEDLFLLLARATALQSEGDVDRRDELLRAALDYNTRAEAASGGAFSQAGWRQRADLVRRLDGDAAARPLEEKADAAPVGTARDAFLLGQEHMAGRRFREALPLLQEATDRDPRHFWAWYCQGVCHFELAQDVEAVQCYRAGLALWPDSHEFHFGRGLAYQRLGRRDKALQDFDEAIRLRPDLGDLYVNRALLRSELGKTKEAVEDLTSALERGASPPRVYLLRSAERARAGDAEGARADRAEALKAEPADAVGWTSRGWARMDDDPKGALADFDEALKLNPRYIHALQNKAHVLSELLKRDEDALAVIDREVELYPDYTPARVGRGVLRARLGKAEQARADAEESLKQDRSPVTLYQAANIYALTSPKVPDDRARALDLLTAALRGGFGLDVVNDDSDFAPIRGDPEFRRVVEAARTLQAAAKPGG
jgi:serine/threonine protein kinase/Tfp pilus assembly protein PilF